MHWKKSELNALDRKSRKRMTMYGALHPKSDMDRLYMKWQGGGRGLIGVERCDKEEENSLGFYVANSSENLIRRVTAAETIRMEGIITSREFKKEREQELKKNGMRREYVENLLGKCLRKLIRIKRGNGYQKVI